MAKHYDLLEKMLGQIDSLEAAPISTRKKVNAAYEDRLAWSFEIPRGYICSPLGAPDHAGILQNMLAARKYSEVAERNLQIVGKAPHAWLPEFLNDHDPAERQIGLDVGTRMLQTADCCVVCGDRVSQGMKAEIALAGKENITVYTFTEETKKAVEEIIGTQRKHINIDPTVTSDLRILAMTPEEINGLNLPEHEKLLDPSKAPTVYQSELQMFSERYQDDLAGLDSYAEYRFNRDSGGDFIPAYERQMERIEKKLTASARKDGLDLPDVKALVNAAVQKQTPAKTQVQNISHNRSI